MSEWHLTPEYLLDNWTEELFALMFKKRLESFEASRRAVDEPEPSAQPKRVTDMELFQLPGVGYRRVN